MSEFKKVRELLEEFKGKKYIFGLGVLDQIGQIASQVGKTALLFRETFPGSDIYVNKIIKSLKKGGVNILGTDIGARPNAPREDLLRIAKNINNSKPDMVISFGGGSTIDAVKAAVVLYSLGGEIDNYFGVKKVTNAIRLQDKKLIPHIAIQTLASSGAHLTKYSNITDIAIAQKKLIVDEAIVPTYSLFDYGVTYNAPIGVTCDGAFDGLEHMIEVLYSEDGKSDFNKIEDIANTGIELIIKHLPKIINDSGNKESRDALCYATDLGGYAIMLGGTSGPHLNSFSFVDILAHGRACAILLPYYTVFFAPSIENSLKLIGNILNKYGYLKDNFINYKGKYLGISVAQAMFAFAKAIGFPTKLNEVDGFTQSHIERALTAAKDSQLESKLQNMPVPLSIDMIDVYMGSVLEAAKNGDLNIIRNVNK